MLDAHGLIPNDGSVGIAGHTHFDQLVKRHALVVVIEQLVLQTPTERWDLCAVVTYAVRICYIPQMVGGIRGLHVLPHSRVTSFLAGC